MVELGWNRFVPNRNQQFWGCLHDSKVTIGVKEDVGGFEISVNDTLHMTFSDSCQHLIEEFFDLEWLHQFISQSLHVCPQILIEIFKNKVKLFVVDHNIFKSKFLSLFTWQHFYVQFLWEVRFLWWRCLEILNFPYRV